MANVNRVILIGRLTRDPEVQVFQGGGKVAKLGFAVSNSRKNQQTGAWENEPVFLDCEAFNKGETGKLADTIMTYLKKGSQAYLEGHLKMDQWTSKEGEKRSKLKIVVDVVQLLDPKQNGERTPPPATNDEWSSPPGEQQAAPKEEAIPF